MTRTWIILALVAMLAVAGAGIYFVAPSLLRTADHQPPLNTVIVSDSLATSGQPSGAQLGRLHAKGYTAVINLAPPGSYGALRDEPQLVAAAGMQYLGIPVNFDKPDPRDFDRFRSALGRLRGQRVWVHCQMNMRASVFVFLYRVIDEGAAIDRAIEAVHAVWVPNAAWTGLIRTVLAHHRVSFDPDLLR